MPLKVSSNSSGTWITWEMPDESVSTTFRLKTKMTDEEILKTLVKAASFISKEMGLMQDEIALLEAEIGGVAQGVATSPTAPATTAIATDPSTPRIPMMSPASLSDQPAGGAVPFGWGDYPTTTVPEHLQAAWEIIPPGEA